MDIEKKKPVAWGIDYRRTRRQDARHEERWILALTRLDDGRLIASWECSRRPGVEEVRRVLGLGLARWAHPELIWCDGYLAHWVTPIAEQYGMRVHVRYAKRPLRVTAAEVRSLETIGEAQPVFVMPEEPESLMERFFGRYRERLSGWLVS